MWIKVKNSIVALNGNAIIRREGNVIRLEMDDALRLGHSTRIADYPNMERAKEVLAEFWAAAQEGVAGYEFPEI